MNSDRDFSFWNGRVFRRKLFHVQGQSYKLLYVFILQQQDSIADSNLLWKKTIWVRKKRTQSETGWREEWLKEINMITRMRTCSGYKKKKKRH